jgi:uncharacterized protein
MGRGFFLVELSENKLSLHKNHTMQLSVQQVQLIQQYCLKQPVLKLYLFGSYVRGTARDNSDIDLLIELDYVQLIGLEFVQMQFDLQTLLGKKVDLVSAKGVSKYIQPIIDAEKQLIYARPLRGQSPPPTHY